eukprot:1140654-Pelagomonas_calceolata.AAC.1
MLMGTCQWRFSGSTRLQNLAVRSITVFNGTPCGNKLVGICDRGGLQGGLAYSPRLWLIGCWWTWVNIGNLQPESLADRLLVKHFHQLSQA